MKSMMIFCSLLLWTATVHAGENLVKNGNFDAGDAYASHWERANGLTSFFEREDRRGRIVKLDTRVDRRQALAWAKTFKGDPTRSPPAPKFPSKKYATIGATEGVMLDSELIEAKPGQDYKLSVDFKGDGKPFVWIKGKLLHPIRKVLVDAYQTRLQPQSPSKTEWRTFSIGFNPTAKSPHVTKFKVRLYAYWPSGVYYFDNVRVEAITPEEMRKLVAKRALKHP